MLAATLGALLLAALIALREQHARHTNELQTVGLSTDRERAELRQIIRSQADHHQAIERAHQAERETWAERSAQPSPDLAEHVALIDRLCQRLQAPEMAVVAHDMDRPLPSMPQPPAFDDDEAYNTLHGLSKEQLAELVEAEIA